MSVNLGKELVYGSPSLLQVWLDGAVNIVDPCVFLVRAGFGSPAFARVCTEADLYNYPDSDLGVPGWYRVSGITFELSSSETMGRILEKCQHGLDGLDAELLTIGSASTSASASASAETAPSQTLTIPLHLYRTGAEIGTMTVIKTDLFECFAYTVTVDFQVSASASVTEALFKVSSDSFRELLGVCTPDDVEDVSASADIDYEVVDEITVYLNKDKPELEGMLFGALSADIEDLYSFLTAETSA